MNERIFLGLFALTTLMVHGSNANISGCLTYVCGPKIPSGRGTRTAACSDVISARKYHELYRCEKCYKEAIKGTLEGVEVDYSHGGCVAGEMNGRKRSECSEVSDKEKAWKKVEGTYIKCFCERGKNCNRSGSNKAFWSVVFALDILTLMMSPF